MSDPRPKLVGPKFVANQWKENPSTAGALTAFAGFGFMAFVVAIVGIAGYLAFLMTVDVPMYLRRWRTKVAVGNQLLSPLAGLRDASTRWCGTHARAEWQAEQDGGAAGRKG